MCAGFLWFLGSAGLARPGEGATDRPPPKPAERGAALASGSDPAKPAAPREPGSDKDVPASLARDQVKDQARDQVKEQAKDQVKEQAKEPARGDGGAGSESSASVESVDVVRALERRGLTTMIKALQAAGLDRTLQGAGPYTVFAPTESAWKKLSGDKLGALLHDRGRLRTVLGSHVLKGRVLGKTVVILKNALMMSGAIIPIDGSHGLHQTRIQGALLVAPDVVCKNGVIHMIDGVLSPERTNKAAVALTDDTAGAEGAEPGRAVVSTAVASSAAPTKGPASSSSRRSSRGRK